MSWTLQVILAGIIFLAGGAAGVKVHSGMDAKKALAENAARVEKERNDRKAVDVAATEHEDDKAKIQIVYVKAKQEVARVVKAPFYSADQLCLDDAGLRAVEAAGRAAPAPSVPAATVP